MKSKKKNKIKKSEYLKVEIGKSYSFQTRDNKIKKYLIFIIMLMGFFASAFLIYKLFIKKEASIPFIKPEEKEELKKKIYFDKYEVEKFNSIKETLIKYDCSHMWDNQREFLNGLVRKFKPKKVLEVGVHRGGSSIIILNAINDIEDSKLYSIDINPQEIVGECVNKYFPNLSKKYTLFKGNFASAFMEQIGNDIDMAFFDTTHLEPGEILDFIIALPFLKENAIVIFHDIANQITRSPERNEYAPYIIFNGIRGEKYLPSGDVILKQDIGAAKLDSNQKKYYKEYFRLLGGQWQYFLEEEHVTQIRDFFKKYYEKDCKECLIIFEEAVTFNRDFVKRNPKK